MVSGWTELNYDLVFSVRKCLVLYLTFALVLCMFYDLYHLFPLNHCNMTQSIHLSTLSVSISETIHSDCI